MSDTMEIKITVSDYNTCPLCDEKIKRGQICMPLYSNRKLIGYAHKRCSDIIDSAMEIIDEVNGR